MHSKKKTSQPSNHSKISRTGFIRLIFLYLLCNICDILNVQQTKQLLLCWAHTLHRAHYNATLLSSTKFTLSSSPCHLVLSTHPLLSMGSFSPSPVLPSSLTHSPPPLSLGHNSLLFDLTNLNNCEIYFRHIFHVESHTTDRGIYSQTETTSLKS